MANKHQPMIRQRKYSPSDVSNGDDEILSERPVKARKSNLYDAAAGNVTQSGLLRNVTDSKASRQALRPDEVLFKQNNAPIRYEETDYYFAHENLSAEQKLPSGDLLSALHAYVSKLYSKTECPDSERAWKCMDETALIALGILMEETAREVLGETGDLAFTEAADEEEEKVSTSENEENNEQGTHRRLPVVLDAEKNRSDSWSSSSDGSRYITDDSE